MTESRFLQRLRHELTMTSTRKMAVATGISKTTLNDIVNKKTKPKKATVDKILYFLDSQKRATNPETASGELFIWVPRESSTESPDAMQNAINVTNFPYGMSPDIQKKGGMYPAAYYYHFIKNPELLGEGDDPRTIIYKTKYSLPLSNSQIKKRVVDAEKSLKAYGATMRQIFLKTREVEAILNPKLKNHYEGERRTEETRAKLTNRDERAYIWDNTLSDAAKTRVNRKEFIETGELGTYYNRKWYQENRKYYGAIDD